MYKALDVADYIINYIDDQGHISDSYKVNAILFFIQGMFLILRNRPCFDDDIIAVDFGAVVPDVYDELGHSSCSLDRRPTAFVNSTIQDRGLIRELVDIYRKPSWTHLMLNIIKPMNCWKQARKRAGHVISPEELKKDFEEKYLGDSEKTRDEEAYSVHIDSIDTVEQMIHVIVENDAFECFSYDRNGFVLNTDAYLRLNRRIIENQKTLGIEQPVALPGLQKKKERK